MESASGQSATTPLIEYTDAKTLMAHGSEALHDHLVTRIETAMGKMLPQMEVRFRDVSITAEVTVSKEAKTNELPTVANEFKKMFARKKSKNQVTKHILRNVSGVLKPGTTTLVLGQPGSGKSSLMKILSGRFPDAKNVTKTGEISYNGASQDELRTRLPQFVSYVTQRDHHFATLSVKETLEFAHACCGGGEILNRAAPALAQGSPEENKMAMEAAQAMFEHYPDVIIQQLGLENCQNTVVGDAMLRGVSGGEKKRVTTGEMQFGTSFVSLMDEISTGLDSAATYDIIKTQRSIAKNLRKTVVISLLQPSPEVFGLFDNVIILNDGYVMYQGSRDQALSYFESLGFQCPPRRDVADFILDLGTHQQHQYEVPRADGSKHPRKPSEFAAVFERSSHYGNIIADLESQVDPVLANDKTHHFDSVPEFHQSFWNSTKTLLRREFTMLARNRALLQGRGVMLIVMGLLYSTIFYQFNVKDAQVVMGILFTSVLFLALGQASQIPVFMAARQIFYKQRGSNFFRTSSYVLSYSLSQIPLAIFETVLFGTLVYWMCGFVATPGAFFMFELILLLTNMAFTSWFFFLTAASPDIHVAEPISMVTIICFILFAGFVISKDQIPVYLIWVYWINPVAWSLRALAVNQYRNDKFNVCEYEGVDYCKQYGMRMGKFTLSLFDVEDEKLWLWCAVAMLAFAYIAFMLFACYFFENKRYETAHNSGVGGEDEETIPVLGSDTGSEVGSHYDLVETPRKNEAVVEVRPSMYEKRFTPVTLAFRDLWYSVPDPANPKEQLQLLKGINGFALPGKMTALMGSTGAGKTTLMDVIAGRKTGGKIEGEILLNGHQATDLAVRRATGYCEQMDIHSEASTIREALTFSAFLRQDSDVPASAKFDSVEECLDLLDLRPIADQIIRGSSVEQMKRLTIGVELAAQPSVLFLDEPTSGLDARSAKLIMDGVRKVADSGRTIICTIHQPSTEVFMLFDSLLLLKRGGQTVYFGDLGKDACELIQYFESVPGVASIENGYNPGTWMLEVIGAGVGNTANNDKDFVAIFNASEKSKVMEEMLSHEGVGRPAPGMDPILFTSKRAASEMVQAKFVIQRFMRLYWRTPSYNLTRYMVFLMLAVVFGVSYITADYTTYQGVNGGEGMLFLTTMFIGAISFNSGMPLAAQERAAFYRERASQTFNALWYFVGGTLAELPYIFSSTLLFAAIFFPLVGFRGIDNFFLYWLNLSMHVLLHAYMGQCFSYAFSTVEVSKIASVLFISISTQFMGFNPPAEAIPKAYKWLYHITPPKYSFAALSASVFGDCPHANGSEMACKRLELVPPTVPQNLTVKEFVEVVFHAKRDEIWTNFFVVVGVTLLALVLSLLCLRFVNHQKR
ncbi:hypothetical protein Poli38472_010702 [Pythium oligandrum]|uniref:ABC transporter domain-containing protein n=1 Tax=Pythium oligandrum TaxID=41045 RepID=A0A8K1CEN2_PYTOL|nr:hypothetical protein Poli38472_010702 [Pythium oligandrum]|eukprot:TMW61639.1 hypothetical protein Poli38472_010702 [Pythium oligandrum]